MNGGTAGDAQPHAITVLIVDDHPVVRAGLRMMIERAADLFVVGEAADGLEALEAMERLRPLVTVLDIEMPGMNGLDVLREIRKRGIETLPIILTLYDDRDVFDRAIELGARGYIIKDSSQDDIVRGIRRVASGDCFMGAISPLEASPMLKPRSEQLLALESLTPTERRVLRHVAEDRSSQEIADAFFLSPRTVDHHRENISSKLGLSGKFALIRFAVEHRRLLCREQE
jgi:DNA-binding NarL/FixJ family response regulator